MRDDFAHVYAFCRWADDLGDETGDTQRSLELLAWWRDELSRCYDDKPRHPVFVALHRTVQQHDIPRQPFDDLIDAFVQDQRIDRYQSWDQVIDYCTQSANPVGRLVLYMCGHRDEQRQQYSDATCTALQLANFWQDVRRDILERNRVYIPADLAHHHNLDIEQMVRAVTQSGTSVADEKLLRELMAPYCATVQALVDQTWPLFAEGRHLWPLVDRDVRLSISLFTLGGEAILRRIERMDYQTLIRRPHLSKLTKMALMARAVLARVR